MSIAALNAPPVDRSHACCLAQSFCLRRLAHRVRAATCTASVSYCPRFARPAAFSAASLAVACMDPRAREPTLTPIDHGRLGAEAPPAAHHYRRCAADRQQASRQPAPVGAVCALNLYSPAAARQTTAFRLAGALPYETRATTDRKVEGQSPH
ncbi:hypothetical protein FA95DRAFT_337280 [Auriscalpium vulgare]|uniref:Uncharacterized protein n=1 Tax=Auriscalpium vulgare TaxID=40419 RepID=A0ACB8RIQ3_9AGAM|nr:hypothetical protein FA95DRAFT_337280 [Auriscalpium vulgare]